MVTPHLAHPLIGTGEPVTVFVAGAVDAQYVRSGMGVPDTPMVAVRLAEGVFAYVPAALLVPGDILPTLRQMARDAIEFHEDCTDALHVGWREQYERLLDAASGDHVPGT